MSVPDNPSHKLSNPAEDLGLVGESIPVNRANITYVHYHAPVNHVGTAVNSNLGVNNGVIEQSAELSTPPSPSRPDDTSKESNRAAHSKGTGPEVTEREGIDSEDGWRTDQTSIIVQTLKTQGLFAVLKPIPEASYMRNRVRSPPNSQCFPGTRQEVVKRIHIWMDISLLWNAPAIFWVYGYAGCGKSAIAQAICEYYAGKGRLAASFFFFRGAGPRSRAARFAITLASQVAAAIPATEPFIVAAIKANPALLTNATSLGSQIEHLVYRPIDAVKWDRLAAALRHGPFLIALDGLDECEDHGEVSVFIEFTLRFFDEHPRIPIRFLVTSRVESHIHQCLHMSKQVELLDLVNHTSDADILAALEAAIAKEKPSRVLACNEGWPSSSDKGKLVKHIGGSYIFMTTIVKALFDPAAEDGLTPMKRLPRILAMEANFDSLYLDILKKAQHISSFHAIISTIALVQQPLSISHIAETLELEASDVANVLVKLHAIMQVPGDDHTPVTLWHTSLRDFLCSESRAGQFFATPEHHRCLVYRFISMSVPSTQPATTPIVDYARRYALILYGDLMKRVEGDSQASATELENFMAHLQKAFPRDSHRILDTFFRQPLGTEFKRHVVEARTRNWTQSRDLFRGNVDLNLLFPDGQSGPTALETACRERQWRIVRDLVASNPDAVNVRFHGLEDGIGAALHAACHFGETEMVYFLLEKGADPNVVVAGSNWSDWGRYAFPLAWAAAKGDVDLVNQLLACGADPNLKGGWYGWALRACAWEGKDEVARILLERGADPNIQNEYGNTPLHYVSIRGDVGVVKCLLDFKADPNLKSNGGETPLHHACVVGSLGVATYLVDHNADPSIRNNDGETALQVARRRRKQDVVVMLTRRGITE